jgi:superfamily II DNA or RNA helicase
MDNHQAVTPDFVEITRIQDRAIAETRPEMKPGASILIEAPTGAGKTRINSINVANFVEDFKAANGRPPVILALQHRDRLLGQNEKALHRWAKDAGLSTSRSFDGDLVMDKDVNFAMIQTAAANLARIGRVDLVTIDETHHASDSPNADYSKVLAAVGAENPDFTLLTTSATPSRPDGKGLNPRLKDAKRITIGYKELERAGQIILPSTKVVDIRLDDGTPMSQFMRDRFKPEKQAESAGLNKALRQVKPQDYNDQMASAWEREFRAKIGAAGVEAGTISFDTDKRTNAAFADTLKELGYRVAVVDSDQDPEANRRALEDYDAGRLDVLCSVKMLDEGVDCPRTRCVIINRETVSEIEYHQMVGRAMRAGDDPALHAIRPVVLDGGASTMLHGSVERRAEVVDYIQKLERGEIVAERNEDAKHMPRLEGDSYSPWRMMKDPPPVMGTTDGISTIYAVASKAPDGSVTYALMEAVIEATRGKAKIAEKAKVSIMRDASGRMMVGLTPSQLAKVEADRILPSRHSLLRLETSPSRQTPGKSIMDDRLGERPDHIGSVAAMAATIGRYGASR